MSDYNQWHEQHFSDDDTDTPWYNFVKAQLRGKSLDSRTVLEIGCGRCGFSKLLIQEYPKLSKLYACDYSISALEIGKRRIGNDDRVTFKQEDIQDLSFDGNYFDIVISCETLEHVPKPLDALTEIHRVLRPGGMLILTCPNYFNFFGLWCLYRKIIGKPFTEGGQPYVNYILLPAIYTKIVSLNFKIEHFHSSELIIPARVPKTFFKGHTPPWLAFLGSRTFYVLRKNN